MKRSEKRNSFKECFTEKLKPFRIPKTFVSNKLKGKEENVMAQKQWWVRAYQKLFENLISIKVWVLAGNALVSAWLVWRFSTPETIGSMFSDWCAFNGGVVTAIIGMREAFKVAIIKTNGNGNGEEQPKKFV